MQRYEELILVEALRLPHVLIKPRKTISSALVAGGGGYAILPLYDTLVTGIGRGGEGGGVGGKITPIFAVHLVPLRGPDPNIAMQ